MRILIICLLITFNVNAEDIKTQGLLHSAFAECEQLGEEALAIQAIRYELHDITIDELITGLDKLIHQEYEEGSKQQPLFLSRVRAVAKWVFYHYEPDANERKVGLDYSTQCKNKTYAEIEKKFPDIIGGKEDQKRKAAKAWQHEEYF